jgi:Spy/CpxP family protein refolding chaperone
MQDNAAAAPGGMHRMMHGWQGGPPMKAAMAKHLEEMRSTVKKLRDLEAKMGALKSRDDAAAFRAASLEHATLLTDLQESHLKHMEGMMGGGK